MGGGGRRAAGFSRRAALAAAAAAPAAALPLAARAATDAERERRALRAAVAGEQRSAVAFEAIANGDLLGEEATAAIRVLLDHAKAHVAALEPVFRAQTGEKPPLAPSRTAIPGLTGLRGGRDALRLAARLEERAIAAHLDAVRLSRNSALLKLIAGSMGSDAQHLVLIRQLLGDDPVPAPFERGG
ncbi:MAG TPA: ferritin-like domain-containing protein [Thermoleophilaceae bacterium]